MATRQDYRNLFANLSQAIEFENSALNIGREYLPACAIAVLEGDDNPPSEYWDWLCEAVRADMEAYALSTRL